MGAQWAPTAYTLDTNCDVTQGSLERTDVNRGNILQMLTDAE